jgi:UDP-N-acetylmuramate--alanine ligase
MYGRNSGEIFVTLEAAHEKYPDKKIKVIFQPHLYSRTKMLFDDFVDVFLRAPIAGAAIVDIFASRENDPGDISSKMLVDAINMGTISYVPSVKQVLEGVKDKVNSDEVIILMGAGDIDQKTRKYIKND